jgi:DNA-binding CsgD family transcriptional regulator
MQEMMLVMMLVMMPAMMREMTAATTVVVTTAAAAAVTTVVVMTRRANPSRRRTRTATIFLVVGLQILCGTVFVEELLVSVFGLRSQATSWTWREIVEIMATIGLLLGMVLGAMLLRALIRERRRDAAQLRAASGDLFNVVQDHFTDWELTPSERDVAMFMLKGLTNQEIASLRQTSEGTIKAQSTAVFKKAGVTGRNQLMSLFIEELLSVHEDVESSGRPER